MLMAICYLVTQGRIQSERSGSRETMMFEDEQQMARLYERFVRLIIKGISTVKSHCVSYSMGH